jgi:hypothetical protein
LSVSCAFFVIRPRRSDFSLEKSDVVWHFRMVFERFGGQKRGNKTRFLQNPTKLMQHTKVPRYESILV